MQKIKTKAITLNLLIALPVSSLLFRVVPSMAGQVEPTPADCWFFRNGQLEITQTCIYLKRRERTPATDSSWR